MSLASEVAGAFQEAQSNLAQIQGSAAGADNFVGPDGKLYLMVFRAADVFETQAAGLEMQSHGYGGKTLVIATATRNQFDAVPLGWARPKPRTATRLIPAPATEVLIMSVATDDPHHFVFNLLLNQANPPRG